MLRPSNAAHTPLPARCRLLSSALASASRSPLQTRSAEAMSVLFGPTHFSEHQHTTFTANVQLQTLYSFQSAPKGLSVLFCRPLFQKQETKRLQAGLCSANETSTADLFQCKEGEDNPVFLCSACTQREKHSFLGFLFDVGEPHNWSWCRAQIPYLLRSVIPLNSHEASFGRRGRQKASLFEKNKSK